MADQRNDGSSEVQALEAWKDMESEALAGEKPEPWDGFFMVCSTTSTGGQSLQVKAPRKKKDTGDVSFPQALTRTSIHDEYDLMLFWPRFCSILRV